MTKKKKQTKNKKSRKVRVVKPIVEVCRSFSYKLNIPGAYESRDFFASAKKECNEDEIEKTSEALYDFVKREVLKSVNQFRGVDTKKMRDVARDEAENNEQ